MRPVGEGLFEVSPDPRERPWLLGCRCEVCEAVVFPRMLDCPACMGYGVMRPMRLSGLGRIRDFVVARRGPTGFPVPYVQAYVELVDGPVVFTTIDGCEPADDALRPGQEVEMVVREIRTEDGVAIVGWTFRPTDGARDG